MKKSLDFFFNFGSCTADLARNLFILTRCCFFIYALICSCGSKILKNIYYCPARYQVFETERNLKKYGRIKADLRVKKYFKRRLNNRDVNFRFFN